MMNRRVGLVLVGFALVGVGCNGAKGGPNGAAYVAKQAGLPPPGSQTANTNSNSGTGTSTGKSPGGSSTPGGTTPPGGGTTPPGGTTPAAGPGAMPAAAGPYLYVLNATDTISAYSIDPNTGALTAGTDAALPTGFGGTWLALDPTSTILFASGAGGSGQSGSPAPAGNLCPIVVQNQSGGTITPGTVATTASIQPFGVAVDPVSEFVFTADFNNFTPPPAGQQPTTHGTVSAFGYATGTGALTAGTPPSATAGDAPTAVLVDPAGQNVFVCLAADAAIGVIPLNAGALNPGAQPQGVNLSPQHQCNTMAFNSTGSCLYVGNADDTISVLTFSASAAPTQVDVTAHTPALANKASITGMAVDPTGAFLVTANGGTANGGTGTDDASLFTINSTTGALTFVASTAPVAKSNPFSAAFSGANCYVACPGTNNIAGYSVTATGMTALAGSPFTIPTTSQAPLAMVVGK